ncbi:MAG: nucleotidyltransferase domain-containing protein [Bacteroidetes bacterium]|nr:nucleotidyltransferase domain-containing protein [Bacteroidota bacterium]MBL7105631.1 nucleotidyltransferase domain-containing protein [Bacteroidales bacterium]
MDKRFAIELTKVYINKLITNNININSAYLFGSFAKGIINKNSDIDLALIIDDYINDFETQIKLMTLREGDETIIEPHIFRKDDFNKNNPFINEIINSGIRIEIN